MIISSFVSISIILHLTEENTKKCVRHTSLSTHLLDRIQQATSSANKTVHLLNSTNSINLPCIKHLTCSTNKIRKINNTRILAINYRIALIPIPNLRTILAVALKKYQAQSRILKIKLRAFKIGWSIIRPPVQISSKKIMVLGWVILDIGLWSTLQEPSARNHKPNFVSPVRTSSENSSQITL